MRSQRLQYGRYLAAIYLFITILNTYGNGSNERSLAQSAYHNAENLISERRLNEALQELDKAVWLQPDEGKYREARGNLFLLLHNPGMALRDSREWERIEPKNGKSHAQEGLALQMADKHYEAVEAFTTAISLDEKAEYYYGRAKSLEDVKELWSALNDYKQAVRLLEAGEIAGDTFFPYINEQMYVDLWAVYFRLGFVSDAWHIRDASVDKYVETPITERFDLSGILPNELVQIGMPIPDFEIKSADGIRTSRTELLGKVYVLFRWDPILNQITLSSDWPAGPMDAIVLEDDVSIMRDAFDEIKRSGAELISIATQPLGTNIMGQIFKARIRYWPLFELPSKSQSWLAKEDYKGLYRVLVVDQEGIIQMALLSRNVDVIRESLLPTIIKLIQKTAAGNSK